MSDQRDYLIIGQGLAGTALAWELIHRGYSVMVYDQPSRNRASAVAAGLFNPITGRVMTKSWKAEVIFPFLLKFYRQAEEDLKRKFLHERPLYRPFLSMEERRQWEARAKSPDLRDFVFAFSDPDSFASQVNDPFGGIEISKAGYLDVNTWMLAVRDFLRQRNSYHDEAFDESALVANESITYKDFQAKQIVFCNGVRALETQWFGWLPIRQLKGEVIDVRMVAVPERVYNQGVYLVPSGQESVFRAGATYEHIPFTEAITEQGRDILETRLQALVRLPFEIIHQEWGIRPTTPDRRPLLGCHPLNKNVIIFNGLGTKGVSLAPYFANQLTDWLEGKATLQAEVNINRFKTLYSG